MSWTEEELRRVGDAVELELASRRPDGELRPYTTMWVVRVGDDLYVRSAGGPDRPWYRHALEQDVAFADADPGVHGAIDEAYHAKYDRFGPGPVGAVTGPAAHPVTIRLVRP